MPTIKKRRVEPNADVTLAKLRRLVACDRTTEAEATAFADMLRKHDLGKLDGFSRPQCDWIDRAYAERELDAEDGSLNLASLGVVPAGIAEPHLRHYEQFRRPLKPPHVMAKLSEEERARMVVGAKRERGA